MNEKSAVSKKYDSFIAKKHEVFSPFDHESWNAQEWQELYYSCYGKPDNPEDPATMHFNRIQEINQKRWEAEGRPCSFDIKKYRAKVERQMREELEG